MAMTLEEFIAKTKEKEESKIKIIVLEVEGFGKIEFQRPSESKFLKFSNEMLSSVKGLDLSSKTEEEMEDADAAQNNIKTENINLVSFAKAASEFIYHSCSYMRDQQIRKIYKNSAFEDIPLCILGQSNVITLATMIYKEFNGKKEVQEIEEELKN